MRNKVEIRNLVKENATKRLETFIQSKNYKTEDLVGKMIPYQWLVEFSNSINQLLEAKN
jgi:hypothetical protein